MDRHKRQVAVCSSGGAELNAWLVREGWAADYERYSGGEYADAQAEAQKAKRRIWSGVFVKPWEWRKAKKHGR